MGKVSLNKNDFFEQRVLALFFICYNIGAAREEGNCFHEGKIF